MRHPSQSTPVEGVEWGGKCAACTPRHSCARSGPAWFEALTANLEASKVKDNRNGRRPSDDEIHRSLSQASGGAWGGGSGGWGRREGGWGRTEGWKGTDGNLWVGRITCRKDRSMLQKRCKWKRKKLRRMRSIKTSMKQQQRPGTLHRPRTFDDSCIVYATPRLAAFGYGATPNPIV